MANNRNHYNIDDNEFANAATAWIIGAAGAACVAIYYLCSNKHPGPAGRVNSKIVVVETGDKCREVVRVLKSHCQQVPLLGFDCEWVDITRGPSLLQLSDHTGYCALIRMKKLDYIPMNLKTLLEDWCIIKLGVGPEHDVRILKPLGIHTVRVLDLRFVRAYTGFGGAQQEYGRGSSTLKSMAQRYLGVTIDESAKFSNWDTMTSLSAEQIKYAASDATTAVDLYKFFVEHCSNREVRKAHLSHMRNYLDATFVHTNTYSYDY